MREIKKILIATIPRSGTVFFFNFIAKLFDFNKLEPKFTGGFRAVPPEWDPYKFDQTYLELGEGEVICAHYYLNDEVRQIIEQDDVLCLYLYRDPRDVTVSAVLYIKYALTHHPLHPLFARLSESDALLFFLAGGILPVRELPYETTGNAQHIRYEGLKLFCEMSKAWLSHPRVAKLRYEDFFSSPAETLRKSLAAVDVGLEQSRIAEVAAQMDFHLLSGGRERGMEDKTSHYRKGLSGDFRNYFTDVHRAVCKYIVGEDLIRMGYETGYDW